MRLLRRIQLWAALTVLRVLTFSRLRRSPGLLALHVGFMLIVAGAFWGSQTGNRLAIAMTGRGKLPAGYMAFRDGEVSNTVGDAYFEPELGRLPFSIQVGNFQVE